MSPRSFILASLWHHRRIHVAVVLGVAVATAVLTGALLVGDSVRGSLRDLTLQRLGRIDQALVTGRLFRQQLAAELADSRAFQQHFTGAHPALLLRGTLQSGSGRNSRRAGQVAVIGGGEQFHTLGDDLPPLVAGERVIYVTRPLAAELGIAEGDELLLRVPLVQTIPAESALGEKLDITQAQRLTVAAVLPAHGLPRFSLRPSQHLPRNAFVPLDVLQKLLDQPGRVNAVLIAADHLQQPSDPDAEQALQQSIAPTLADYGLAVDSHPSGEQSYLRITSESLVLPPEVVAAAEEAFGPESLQRVTTYLANTLIVDDNKIPYSTVAGVDSIAEVGPLLSAEGNPIRLDDDEIVLNRWAAEDLGAEPGDSVKLTFYEPESTHGQLREHQPDVVLRLKTIVDLQRDDGTPTPAADPALTPPLAGVTDQESIDDWDLPFELVETIRDQDEDYWDQYSTTPKGFVSRSLAERLWSSRWGTTSVLRIPTGGGLDVDSAAERLREALEPAELGFALQPVKQAGLAASAGTTPFDALFLGFSFFLIAAAVMLIALLFQLGLEQRAGEVGILAATGIGRRRITHLLGREALVVAAVGGLLGVVGGVAYAWLMIAGLTTVWVDAIATPFLDLHITLRSLAIGGAAGVVICWLTTRLCLARLLRTPAKGLLAGRTSIAGSAAPGARRRWTDHPLITASLYIAALGLCVLAIGMSGEARAGAFLGSGAMLLAALLQTVWRRLGGSRRATAGEGLTLTRLAGRTAARNPGRTTLTLGLVAAASFLIVAIGAFRLGTSDEGTGGYALLATSDVPILHDLNTAEGRFELAFTDRQSDQLDTWQFVACRVQGGEDASCLNLYRPTQPRVVGVPEEFLATSNFAWAASIQRPAHLKIQTGEDYRWYGLKTNLGEDQNGRPVVPVVLDANTATYSLHLGGVGSRLKILDGYDQPVTLEVVGLLKNSVLQGDLLVSEKHFLRLFPIVGGYQFFLARPASASDATEAPGSDEIAQLLESQLSDFGFDAVDAQRRLAGFLAVQNTYLSTFQSLGALGLLLGTVGLAVVQIRSTLERRGELALLRAGGFRASRIRQLVLRESGLVLLGGLGVGCLAAAVAVLPHAVAREAGIPWGQLAVLLAVIALVGILAAWWATRAAVRTPLLAALRGD